MKVGVIRESFPGERRVALVPADIPKLNKAGFEVVVEPGAGAAAGYLDNEYVEKGGTLTASRDEALAAELVLQVRSLGANPEAGAADLAKMNSPILIGMCDPLGNPQATATTAETGATQFALELIPRITRAQSMDVLSSMATIAGYRAVLLASVELPKIFPMLMTAAGTVTAAKVFIIGAGVAGLQAIATARRLGAIVHAYDVRPACREQVESLGAKFLELDLQSEQAEDKGGYAKALGEEFYEKQRAQLADFISECDVVISTAAIPGRQSPLLITKDAVERMPPGGVIVDLAAERGGNCELSEADQRVVEHDVVILGPTNLPAEIPKHASQMFSSNLTRFLLNMVDKEGKFEINLEDEIVAETLACRDGEVFNARMREALDLPPLVSIDEEMPIEEDDDEPKESENESAEASEDKTEEGDES